jgi:hypothetical protein
MEGVLTALTSCQNCGCCVSWPQMGLITLLSLAYRRITSAALRMAMRSHWFSRPACITSTFTLIHAVTIFREERCLFVIEITSRRCPGNVRPQIIRTSQRLLELVLSIWRVVLVSDADASGILARSMLLIVYLYCIHVMQAWKAAPLWLAVFSRLPTAPH